MKSNNSIWTRLSSRALLLALAVGSLGLAGCDEPASLDEAFLIRTPERRPSVSMPVSFQVSAADTSSLLFEWEPSSGASSYTITFWQGESEEQVEDLEADFSTPLLSWEVTAPQIEEVFLNPDNPNDERSVHLVRHRVPMSQIAAELEAAGVPTGTPIYTVFSVFAERGNDRWRSPALHPVIFVLEGGA